MKKGALTIILIATLSLAIANSATSASAPLQDSARLERGKQLFSAKCAQCHDVDARKRLPDGTTLLSRLAANKDPRTRLMTRLNKMSEEDARAVIFYVQELIGRYSAEQNGSADKREN